MRPTTLRQRECECPKFLRGSYRQLKWNFQHRLGMASRWRIRRIANVSTRHSVNVKSSSSAHPLHPKLCIRSFRKAIDHICVRRRACPCGDREFPSLKLVLRHGDLHHSITSFSGCEAGTPPFPFLQSSITCVIGFGFGFSFGRSLSQDLERRLPI